MMTGREVGIVPETYFCSSTDVSSLTGFVTHFAGANATEKIRKQKVVSTAGKIKIEDISAPGPDKYVSG